MQHSKMFPYLVGAAIVAAALIATGFPLASMLPFVFLLMCPVMMVFMMRGMSGSSGTEDHSGHGCEHDPAHKTERPVRPVR